MQEVLSQRYSFTTLWNYTILKLVRMLVRVSTVLLPYEITLFSNNNITNGYVGVVLLPYEITLFSNDYLSA